MYMAVPTLRQPGFPGFPTVAGLGRICGTCSASAVAGRRPGRTRALPADAVIGRPTLLKAAREPDMRSASAPAPGSRTKNRNPPNAGTTRYVIANLSAY